MVRAIREIREICGLLSASGTLNKFMQDPNAYISAAGSGAGIAPRGFRISRFGFRIPSDGER